MVSRVATQGRGGDAARRRVPVFVAAIAIALWLLVGSAWAAGSVTVAKYDVHETMTMTVNGVGDVHYVDVLKYEPSFFNASGFTFDQYPALLSRRYEQQAAVREIRNFKASLDREKGTVTLSFDKPGFAINMGDRWRVPFFYEAPKSQVEGAQIFEQESTENSEYTLWQDLDFKTTTRLEVPASAENIHWDEEQNAVVYDLAYIPPPAEGNVLQSNRGVFVPLFAALMIAAVALAVWLLVRRRPASAPVLVSATASLDQRALVDHPTVLVPGAPEQAEVGAASPGQGALAPGPAPATSTPRFCTHCGTSLAEGARFCPSCGRETA